AMAGTHLELERTVNKFGFFHKQCELMIMLPHVPKLRDLFEMFALKASQRRQQDAAAKALAKTGSTEGAGEGGDGSEDVGKIEETDIVGPTTIDFSEMAECLRTMGLFPSDKWLSDRLAEQLHRREALGALGAPVVRRASFELVLTVYCQLATIDEGPTVEDMLRALRSCDPKGTGVLPYGQMRHMLTAMGERLDDLEVSSLLNTVSDGCGNIHYEQLVRKIFTKDAKSEEIVHQARLYLQAIGRNAIDMDMTKRDEFIDALRLADPDNTGCVDRSHLLTMLNRCEDNFTDEELRHLTEDMEDSVHGGVNYRSFLRFIMHE
ncbi:hypothetical protein KR018_008281, partial [Drosophila ironensis]